MPFMHIHIHVTCTCTGQDWTAEGWHKADLFTIHCMLGNKFTLTVLYPGFQKWGSFGRPKSRSVHPNWRTRSNFVGPESVSASKDARTRPGYIPACLIFSLYISTFRILKNCNIHVVLGRQEQECYLDDTGFRWKMNMFTFSWSKL